MDEWKYPPAGDQGLDPHASLRSLKREAGLVATVTQTAWRVVVRAYLRGYHRLRVDGVEHIPAKPPFVMIANHSSHLDVLALVLRHRRGIVPGFKNRELLLEPCVWQTTRRRQHRR